MQATKQYYNPVPSTHSKHRQFFITLAYIILGETLLLVIIFSIVLQSKVIDFIQYEQQKIATIITTNKDRIEAWVNNTFSDLSVLATSKVVIDFLADPSSSDNQVAVNALITPFLQLKQNIYAVTLVLYRDDDSTTTINIHNKNYIISSGMVALDTQHAESSVGAYMGDKDYIQNLINRGYHSYMSDAHPSLKEGGEPIFVFSQLVKNKGKTIGVVLFTAELSHFSNLFANIFTGKTGKTFIVDERMLILSYPQSPHRMLTSIELSDGLPSKAEISKTNLYRKYKTANEHQYFFYSAKFDEITISGTPFYLLFRQNASEVLSPIYLTIFTNALIGFLIILVSTVLLIWVSKRFTRSIIIEQQKATSSIALIEEINITDRLTGLYNRHFFESMSEDIEHNGTNSALILGDVDGLKLINDSFGHIEGDILLNRATTILRGSVPRYTAIRFGGDEFAIILPGVSYGEALYCLNRLLSAVDLSDTCWSNLQIIPTSISFGFAYYNGVGSFKQTLDEADKELYKIKSIRSPKVRQQSLEIFLKYLKELSPEKENRIAILEDFCCLVAKYYEPGLLKLSDLKSLIRYHNLGEITSLRLQGEKESVSFTEAGYRIAMYLPEISNIADLILKQDEHYDGSGPMALREKKIPLECRIFIACSTFDTNYLKNGLDYAKDQLDKQEGAIFDPLVVLYIHQVAHHIYPSSH